MFSFVKVLVFILPLLTAQQTYEEAKQIIQNYVKSYGHTSNADLCTTNTCCTMSSTQKCAISGFKKDSSTLVLPGGKTRCIFSDSTPYAFQVSFHHLSLPEGFAKVSFLFT